MLVAQQACADRGEAIGGKVGQAPGQVKVLRQPRLQLRRAFDSHIQGRGIGEQQVGLHGIGHGRCDVRQYASLTCLPATQPANAQGYQQHRRGGPVALPAQA
ncbi:hypothetical protein D3C85_897120 [compost metagenome]